MTKVQMRARTSACFDEGFVARGKSFSAANEENARLYEEQGLAVPTRQKSKRADKQISPEQSQDISAREPLEEPKSSQSTDKPEGSAKRGRPRKNYDTKSED